MTPNPERIVEIAESLSEAQRRTILSIKEWRSAFDMGLSSNNKLEILRRWGLLVRDGEHNGKLAPVTDYYYALSCKGLAVRDHLKDAK